MEGKKQLGLASLTALVTGDMIGSGVFLLPSEMARLGSLSLISWVFTALGTMFLAFVFSRMSSLVTKTGGPYAYAREGLGNVVGFQTAYCYWIAIWVGNAAIALAACGYLSVFFPILSQPIYACLASIAFVWLFTLVNLGGIHGAGIVQLVTTVLKLIPIFFIGIVGWFYFKPDLIVSSANVSGASSYDLITHGATLTLWAFIGVESATVPSGSVKNPTRNIPLATIMGTAIAAIAYIASSTVIMGMIPNEALQTSLSPFADAAQIIFGTWGKWLIAIGAIVSCLGALNGWILLQGQVPMAAADDNLFLRIFSRRNRNGVPAHGLIITSVLISVLLFLTLSPDLVKQFKVIILMATLANLIPYLYTPVSEIILLRKVGWLGSKVSVFVAIAAILYSFWAIMGAGTDILSYGSLLILSSVPLYIFATRSESKGF